MSRARDIGMFDTRVRFERPIRTPDALGGASISWDVYADRWAFKETLRGREVVQADATQDTTSFRLIIRRDDNITADMRCVIDGMIHHIDWIAPYDNRNDYMECHIHRGGHA